MLNLRPFQRILNLPKFLECLRLRKPKVVFNLIPPREQHKLLILPFFIDSPPTRVRKRCRMST